MIQQKAICFSLILRSHFKKKIMIKKIKVLYGHVNPKVKIDLIIYWIVYHLIILYFIYGEGLLG